MKYDSYAVILSLEPAVSCAQLVRVYLRIVKNRPGAEQLNRREGREI